MMLTTVREGIQEAQNSKDKFSDVFKRYGIHIQDQSIDEEMAFLVRHHFTVFEMQMLELNEFQKWGI